MNEVLSMAFNAHSREVEKMMRPRSRNASGAVAPGGRPGHITSAVGSGPPYLVVGGAGGPAC